MIATTHVTRLTWMRYLTGELDANERTGLEEHSASCRACATALEDLHRTQEEGRRIAPPLRLPEPRSGWTLRGLVAMEFNRAN